MCTALRFGPHLNAEVARILNSEGGQSYRKGLLEVQLWADGWRRVEEEEGSVKYVGGEFLGSSQAHSRTKTALPFASPTQSGTFLGPTRANAYGPGNPSVHNFGSSRSIVLSQTTYQGNTFRITFEQLKECACGLVREARRRSENNWQWFGNDEIVGIEQKTV